MRKILIGLVLGVGLAVAIGGGLYFYGENRIDSANAIVKILNQSASDLAGARDMGDARSFEHYSSFISKYDTAQCSRNFQKAWVDYCAAWKGLADEIEREQTAEFAQYNARRRRENQQAAMMLFKLAVDYCTCGTAVALHAGEHMAASAVMSHSDQKAPDDSQARNTYLDKMAEAAAAVKKTAIEDGVIFH